MKSKIVILTLAGLLLITVLMVVLQRSNTPPVIEIDTGISLQLPELSDADYDWIASRIFQNETGGQTRYLTYWGDGEDFPSFGIGHFIWFPAGVDAPFDETFPDMVAFVQQRSAASMQFPGWMQTLQPFAAPWSGKKAFDEAWSSTEMIELRGWLEQTRHLQARFIVSAFEQRWQSLDLPAQQKQRLTGLLQQLLGTAQGLFAVLDYYNFKGLGSNPRERYQQQGWGLVQVLEAMPARSAADQSLLERFRQAAASRLRLRVELSPPERNETRWLDGWLLRLDGYVSNGSPSETSVTSPFRVRPYLQNPRVNAITLSWFSDENKPARVTIWRSTASDDDSGTDYQSSPVLADALAYHPAEKCASADCKMPALPFHHELHITGLNAGMSYRYRVNQNGSRADGTFQTPAGDDRALRFIVYADSETEPESKGQHASWPGNDAATQDRRYPVDQTTGYAQNLKVIRQRQPAFVAIAGDLVQSGGEQRDWDEFWLHNAELAASTFIIPALGNHEYFGGPGVMGKYSTEDSERAVNKYKTYFDLPGNDASNPAHAERYYSLEYGVVTLIVLDTTDGQPQRSDRDTNWRLAGEGNGGVAPDWHPGSEQHRWLEKELKKAQQASPFTFVMFHGAPWSSGVHGMPPGDGEGQDILSAQPLQTLTPLFLTYGVDAVFNGHDEMYEHSIVAGIEVTPGGIQRSHQVHFYDIGIAGDGLRGPVEAALNPHQTFLAHSDATEIYSEDGVLLKGGKHYGHLEVNIVKRSDGQWQAQLDAVYIFPVMDLNGQVLKFERRLYDDSITLTAGNLE